jgi:hexosaminidase
LHGLQTLLQLVEDTPSGFAIPVVNIDDQPRFAWRGLLIDVSRHFMPIEVLERNLDAMAAVKLNVLHLHLSDDQGFRVESRRLPKLHKMGSDGMFYTQHEIKHLIAYAHERGIRVVPEFDMPGHTTAWFVGYPELASAPGPYQIERRWGIFDPAMDPSREGTFKFIDKLVGEMARLFPDAYFHIGGDEVEGKQWAANPAIQLFMKEHGLKSSPELQAYFSKRVQEIVHKHKKIAIGWDEVLQPGLPSDVVVQSWRGPKSLADAARQGHRGLLSHGYYLDLMWSAAEHYEVDPMSDADTLTAAERDRIIGGEACMWSEYVSPENIDSRIWPRAAAVAERLWSAQEVRDVEDMYRRLQVLSARLEAAGVKHKISYEQMLRRIAGSDDTRALRVFADVLEPVKDYTRKNQQRGGLATSPSPLITLVDAVNPESGLARRFSGLIDAIAVGHATEAQKNEVRLLLATWRDNDAKLQPVLQTSFLLNGTAPLSQELSRLGEIGLKALDIIDSHQPLPESWATEQLAFLGEASTPQADLLLKIVPALQRVLEAVPCNQPEP